MLEFKVTDQILTRKDKFGVVADSINYLTAKFDFVDSEFGGVITAVFTPLVNGNSYELILTDNSCVVPYEVIKSRGFKVSLYCDINDKRVTTDCVTIPVKESGYVKGETPKEPSPDVYKQLIDIANNAKEIADSVKIRADEGEFKGEKGEKGDNGKDAVTDAELSTESSNAIANKAVANILSSGNLIGIEKISSVEDFEQFQSKYEDVPATDNQYLLLFVTEDIYSGEELTLEKGLIVLTPTDDYKLTCNKEFEEFKKAVEMNFNLFFQALGNYATREKLEQVKADLLRSIELLQSQTEQKITTNKNNLLQLTARVDNTESFLSKNFVEHTDMSEYIRTYTGEATGTSKTTYYGFATRIHTPEKISGVRVYTMVTANAAVTCQLLSSDRITVYAQTAQNVPQSDVPSFVDFMFDDVPDIAEDNIYVAVRSDVKCITQAMTIGSKVNTELVTADNMDETGMANNCFVSGGNWSPVKSTSNKYSFTLQFGILSAETSYSAKLNREEYNLPKMNYIYVSTNGSDETGDGSELKPYATIWHANESITDNSELNRYTIKAANGTYTDLQERFAGDTSTLGAFQGIRTKNYVYYEGNIRNPSACVIAWDGAAGFDLETYTNDQAVDKCPFHIVGSYAEGAMHTSVRGFKIVGKNLRYALHCETAGYGVNVDYEAGDMILEWYGRPDVTDNNNEIPAIGTGSSPFERAYFHDINIQCNSVKPNGEAYKFGFQNHDNANKYNISPAVITGAHYRFENMNFNDSKFQLRSLTDHPSETFDVCEMKNCVGITTAQKIYASVAEKCNWQADVKMCDIADNQLSG